VRGEPRHLTGIDGFAARLAFTVGRLRRDLVEPLCRRGSRLARMARKSLPETSVRWSAPGAIEDIPPTEVARGIIVIAADPAPLHRDRLVPIVSVPRAKMPSRRPRRLVAPGWRQSGFPIGDGVMKEISGLLTMNSWAAQVGDSIAAT